VLNDDGTVTLAGIYNISITGDSTSDYQLALPLVCLDIQFSPITIDPTVNKL